MNSPALGALRLRLVLLHANSVTLAAAVLFAAVSGGTLWMLHLVLTLEAARDVWRAQVSHALAANAAAAMHAHVTPVAAPDHLAQFHAALGERRNAEQQVKTLFDLAAQNGLTLAQGEYKAGYDRDAQVGTYQINLPVKGSYQAIWGFAMGALRAIPFASLDDIGFRRDTIGDAQVEARLRLTLYLSEHPAAPSPSARGVQ